MTIAFDLNELQKIDQMIFTSREFLDSITFKMNDTSMIDECNTKLLTIETALKKLLLQRRSSELLEAELSDRIESLDQRFASVRNNKELTAVQEETNNTNIQLSNCQDELLEILVNLDKLEVAQKSFTEQLPELESSHSNLTSELQVKQIQTGKKLESLESSRLGMQNSLPREILILYEKLLVQTNSKAVSVFDKIQNVCGECRVSQPQHVVQRLNRPNEIIQCNSCKLILYLP